MPILYRFVLLLLCCGVVFAQAQTYEPQTNTLKIKVLDSLSFGSIKAGGVSGSISVAANSPTIVTTTGGVYAISGSVHRPTQVEISGEANTLVYLNLQRRTTLVSEQERVLELDLQLNSSLRHLGALGMINNVYIGGTLKVDANPAAGDYQGEFSITVDYQ